jgi:putative IMPACT (imprinted ancient) family translation regulator
MRIFSQRFAYTQHAQKCLKNVEVEVEEEEDDDNNDSEKYSSEMDTRSNLNSEYENDKVEVIMLFQIILFEALNKKLRLY